MKNPKEIIKDESKEIFSILDRIKRRDFRGNTGIAIKNSLYQFGTNMVSKGGSFIFVIIVARLLLPVLLWYEYLVRLLLLINFEEEIFTYWFMIHNVILRLKSSISFRKDEFFDIILKALSCGVSNSLLER